MSFFPSFNGLQGIFNSSLLGWSQKPPSFSQTLNPHGSWACLPLAHSTFSPTKQAAYSPFLKEGWPTSLPWYPKMLIHLQSCGTNSISSVSHQAFKTCPSAPKELNFPHILYCTTCWFFSWWLFILSAPNQTIFLWLEGKISLYHCLQLPLYICLELGKYERIL